MHARTGAFRVIRVPGGVSGTFADVSGAPNSPRLWVTAELADADVHGRVWPRFLRRQRLRVLLCQRFRRDG